MTTPLPTVEVSDDQLTLLLEVFGDAQGYLDWLIPAIITKVKQVKLSEIQAVYNQRLNELNAQENDAMTALDQRLASVTGS
jgi:hypothetical protein